MTSASIIEALKQLEDEAFFPPGITVDVQRLERSYRISIMRNGTTLAEEGVAWTKTDIAKHKGMGTEHYMEQDVLRANMNLLRRVLWEGVKTLASKAA